MSNNLYGSQVKRKEKSYNFYLHGSALYYTNNIFDYNDNVNIIYKLNNYLNNNYYFYNDYIIEYIVIKYINNYITILKDILPSIYFNKNKININSIKNGKVIYYNNSKFIYIFNDNNNKYSLHIDINKNIEENNNKMIFNINITNKKKIIKLLQEENIIKKMNNLFYKINNILSKYDTKQYRLKNFKKMVYNYIKTYLQKLKKININNNIIYNDNDNTFELTEILISCNEIDIKNINFTKIDLMDIYNMNITLYERTDDINLNESYSKYLDYNINSLLKNKKFIKLLKDVNISDILSDNNKIIELCNYIIINNIDCIDNNIIDLYEKNYFFDIILYYYDDKNIKYKSTKENIEKLITIILKNKLLDDSYNNLLKKLKYYSKYLLK